VAIKNRDRLPIAKTFSVMRKRIYGSPDASISEIAKQTSDPFRVLVSTMISLRTKDEVTSQASARLFGQAETPAEMAELSEQTIADLIFPAGFYRTKAKHIRACAQILLDSYNGDVPSERDALTSLPGVGVKTANLTLNLGFGIDAICVDTHVHRISNRLGWIDTKNPEESEKALEQVLPRSRWIEINGLFVRYGQNVCAPVSPKCSDCPVESWCPKIGVTISR
jgi:endonuclease III